MTLVVNCLAATAWHIATKNDEFGERLRSKIAWLQQRGTSRPNLETPRRISRHARLAQTAE